MTTDQILSLAPALAEFLDEFDDCFGRSEPREHLGHYVRGRLSNLQRKSVEPMALFNNIAPPWSTPRFATNKHVALTSKPAAVACTPLASSPATCVAVSH